MNERSDIPGRKEAEVLNAGHDCDCASNAQLDSGVVALIRDPWMVVGSILLLAFSAMATFSWHGINFGQAADGLLLAATMSHVGAGIAFLVILWRGCRYRNVKDIKPVVLTIVALGVLLRLTAAPTAPAWEDDYYRYLWDGAVTSHGISPYAHAPEAAQSELGSELSELAIEAGIIHERMNHPHLRTIYPPLAQVSFAAAHQIAPWSVNGWRFIILLHDITTCVLLLLLLRSLQLPLILLAIYWINPLVVKEFYQSIHMDALILPWLVGALLLMAHARTTMASILLAAATAVKLWPAMLLPILLRRDAKQPRVVLAAGFVFVVLAGILLGPMLMYEPTEGSGLARYAEAWQNNAGFYAVHHAFWVQVLPLIGVETWHSQAVTRLATMILFIGWIALLTWPRVLDGRDVAKRCVLAVAMLFLISPTQFPWYFVWLVPLLTVWPIRALLLYTALLPLYHLGEVAPWVIWLQHVPVWGLLIHDSLRHHLISDRHWLHLSGNAANTPETRALNQA